MNPYSALADTDEPIDPTDVEVCLVVRGTEKLF